MTFPSGQHLPTEVPYFGWIKGSIVCIPVSLGKPIILFTRPALYDSFNIHGIPNHFIRRELLVPIYVQFNPMYDDAEGRPKCEA